MAKIVKPLTDTKCAAAKPKVNSQGKSVVNKLADGNGLYLIVRPTGTKTWQFIYGRKQYLNTKGRPTDGVITICRRDIPESVHELVQLIEDGFNIASGDHRFDELCTRAYLKRTDMNGKSLPVDQHRLRLEMTFRKTFFERKNLDCSLFNLPSLITHGFKQMEFTRLNRGV